MLDKDHLSDSAFLNSIDFNSGVINSMPGFFYLYEVIGDDLFLRKWNKAHSTLLGYPDKELYNKKASEFVAGKDYEKVEIVLREVFTKGEGQVEARARTKDGRLLPCIFTGYFIQHRSKNYVLGQGIIITYQKQIEQKLKSSKLGEKKLIKELSAKKRELVSTALHISSTAQVIQDILKTLEKIIPNHTECNNVRDLYRIKKRLEHYLVKQDNWDIFRERFKEVHPYFFKNLQEAHPELTKSEMKFAAYLCIRLSTTQILTVLNVSKEAIKKKRYRIRKKIGLGSQELLEDYFEQF
jgi:PAS domain S-box-containing protein